MSSVISFRDLTPDDVELRVAMARSNGCSLLLYKDARVDQTILDETAGQMNWRKSYQVIKDNLFCTIEIWDAEKKQWIAKQDCGVESSTEKEKGEASDAQKRAGFVWGIGRELYTAPFIWVSDRDCRIEEKSRGIYACRDRFSVSAMKIENKKIIELEVVNDTTGKTVFSFGLPETKAGTGTGTPARKLISIDEALDHRVPSKNGDRMISIRSMFSSCRSDDARKKLISYLKAEVKKKSEHSEACLVVCRALQHNEI